VGSPAHVSHSGEERRTGHNKVDVPNLVYTHGDQGEGCSPDVQTEIRFVSLEQIARTEGAAADP